MKQLSELKRAFLGPSRDRSIRWTLTGAAALVGMIATFKGFTGLAGKAFGALALALVFTILLHAMVVYSAHAFARARGIAERLPWLFGWTATSAASVAMGFGFFFSIVGSSALARDSVNEANSKLLAPAIAVSLSYQEIADSAGELAAHSRRTAEQEISQGGTCSDGNNSAREGPRRRFRSRQAEIFSASERHFRNRSAELRRVVDEASSVVAAYGPTRHAATVDQLRRAYANAAALSRDPRLGQWARQLRSSQAELEAVIVDPLNGTRFICPDPVLRGKLAAAMATPEVPRIADQPPPIAEPGHAASVRRGVELITGQATFDPGKDGTALALGSIVDISILLLALMGERDGGRRNADSRRGGLRGGGAAEMIARLMDDVQAIGAGQRARLQKVVKEGDYLTELLYAHLVFDSRRALLIVPLDGRSEDRREIARFAIALHGLGLATPYAARTADKSVRGWEDQIDALPALKGVKRFRPYRIPLRILADLQLDIWRRAPDPGDSDGVARPFPPGTPWGRPASETPRNANNDGDAPGKVGT